MISHKIEVLKKVLSILPNTEGTFSGYFVCHILQDIAENIGLYTYDERVAASDLLDDIKEAFERDGICRGDAVEQWLDQVHNIGLESSEKVTYRIAWVKHWIKSLEKEMT